MAVQTPVRCRCGEPMSENGTCGHCDRGWCDREHPGIAKDVDGPHCQPKHNFKKCPRCQEMTGWEPETGEFEDLPNGYEDNRK